MDRLVDEVSADYGNTILKSSARNEYMIQRTKRMMRRTVWAVQEQLKSGEFEPEGVEVAFQGGRIDRVDTMHTEDGKLYAGTIEESALYRARESVVIVLVAVTLVTAAVLSSVCYLILRKQPTLQ